jgi:DNA-binding response OmpR family regulator
VADRVSERVDILVLEDEQYRIDWLGKHFPTKIVMWAKNPTTFEGSLKYRPRVILLDHDLGKPQANGYDACKTMPGKVHSHTPVLVWSVNPVGAKNIVTYLKNSGFSTVAHLPFGLSEHSLRISLCNILADETTDNT